MAASCHWTPRIHRRRIFSLLAQPIHSLSLPTRSAQDRSLRLRTGAFITSAVGFTNNGSVLYAGSTINGAGLSITNGTLTNGTTGVFQTQSGTSGRTFNGNLINAGGLVQIDAPTTFSKSGSILQQTSGTLNVNNSLTFSSSTAQLNLEGGTLNYTSGTIRGGQFNYLGGTITGTPAFEGDYVTIGPAISAPYSIRVLGSSSLVLSDNALHTGQTLNIDGSAFGYSVQI